MSAAAAYLRAAADRAGVPTRQVCQELAQGPDRARFPADPRSSGSKLNARQKDLICIRRRKYRDAHLGMQNGGFARSAVSELTTLRDRCRAQVWQCLGAIRVRGAIGGRDTA